jgi:hypothetical protein
MTEESNYRYAAFISYRHVDPDRRWAQWLHRALENYRVPKRLVTAGKPARIGRIFRDDEELPASADLSTSINEALTAAQALIVVCSNRTPGSNWVNEEVSRFQKMGRDDRVFAMLLEGEPEQSFPPALRSVEPLAADVRPLHGKSRRSLKKTALLKLLAAVLDVTYDDLRRREEERARRRLAWIAAAAGIAAVIFIGLSVLAAFQWFRAEAELQTSRAQNLANAAQAAMAETSGAKALGLVGPQRAVLLAIESLKIQPSVEGDRALRNALARLLGFTLGIPVPEDAALFSLGPDGRYAVLETEAGRRVVIAATGELFNPESVDTLPISGEAALPAYDSRCANGDDPIATSHSGQVLAMMPPDDLLTNLGQDWVFGGAVLTHGCGKRPFAVLPHEWGIRYALFSPDERAFLTITHSVSRDAADPAATALVGNTVRIWEVFRSTGLPFGKVPLARLLTEVSLATDGDITDIAVSPERNWLALRLRAFSEQGPERIYLQIWPLWPEVLLAEACKHLTRNLSPSEWATYVGFKAYEETCPGLEIVSE